jgi:hypothetical protein
VLEVDKKQIAVGTVDCHVSFVDCAARSQQRRFISSA